MNSNPLKLTITDYKEAERVSELLARIDTGDAVYFDKVTNEIHRHQPFMLSAMLGYSYDLPPAAFEEVLKLYVLIWEFLKENRTAKKKAVTQAQFESVQQKNVHFNSLNHIYNHLIFFYASLTANYLVVLHNQNAKIWSTVKLFCTKLRMMQGYS